MPTNGLRRRGDLTVSGLTRRQSRTWKADKTGKPGGQRVYSDMAIESSGLVVRMVYKLAAYRQTEGFLPGTSDRLASRARYGEIPDLLDVVSALEVAPQEAADSRVCGRALNPST